MNAPGPNATRAEIDRWREDQRTRRKPAYCVCGHARSHHRWKIPPTGKSACNKCPCRGLRIVEAK